MLHFLRQHSRSKAIKVIFVMIIAVFVLWGVGAVVGGSSQINEVATVDDHPISQVQIQRAEYNLLQAYRDAYKERFTPEVRAGLNLRQKALDVLIDRRILGNHAARLGITVSDQELRDAIAGNPAFQSGGRFSKESYLRALRYSSLTPGDFEENLREQLAIDRLQALIEDGVTVSDATAREEVLARDQKASLAYVKVKASDFTSAVPANEPELRRYYDEHKDRYTDPERVEIEAISYPPDRFSAGLSASDDEAAKLYQEHLADRFTQPHEVRARHVLIKAPQGADQATRDAARQKVEEIAEKVKAGGDFAKLAEESSQDEGSAKKGGDLGFFGKGRMVEPFERAAFALAAGEVSEVVETPYGFHLIRVEEVREERVKPLDEVRAEIGKSLIEAKAKEAAGEAAKQDRAAWAGGKSAAELAQARGLAVEQPAPLERGDSLAGVGRSLPLTTALFDLAPGGVTEAIDVNGTWVVARLVEKLPAAAKDFAAVKEQVETAYRLEEGGKLARAAGEKLLAAAKQAGSLSQAAAAEKREVKTTDPFARAGAYVPGIGASQELKDAAFRLTESARLAPEVFPVGGDAIVAELERIDTPSQEKLDEQLAAVRKSMLEARRSEIFQRYLDELKLTAQVSVDRQRLEQMPAA